MRRKTAGYRVADSKAVMSGNGEGIVEAVVAVFGNVDLVGDRIVQGAFAKSLARWKESGDPIPVIFDHQWGNIDAHAGEVLEAEELAPGDPRLPDAIKELGGLWTKQQFDIEDEFARKVFNKLARRRLKEFSFAYDVVEENKADDGANELLELELIEVGPTLKGANPATQLLEVKSEAPAEAETPTTAPAAPSLGEVVLKVRPEFDEETVKHIEELLAKSGRVLSAKNETKLREARDAIDAVLASLEDDGGKATVTSGHSMTPADVRIRLQLLEEAG